MSDVGAVVGHPSVRALGQSPEEQLRIDRFATDIAHWLVGDDNPRSALARVVVLVADQELGDARRLCLGRPLLAIEAAAGAVAALWPLLRVTFELPRPDETDDTELIETWLRDVGAEHSDDPELRQLASQLASRDDDTVTSTADAGRSLADAARAAEDGAMQGEELVSRLETFLPGVGWSGAPQALDQSLIDTLDALARVMSRHPQLDDLAEALGRSEGDAPTGDGGSEQVHGVHLSGDLHTVLPSELALLAHPDTEDLFYQRFIEHRLLSLHLAGAGLAGASDRQVRGPVIACVDTSGSMRGNPEDVAKALVLALCRRVLPQGRAVHLLLFSGPEDRTEVRLGRRHKGLNDLLAFVRCSFGGGTDFDAPLIRALELLDEDTLTRADVLIVTDGLARADDKVIHRVRRAREQLGLRVWSFVVGRDVAGVAAFSDEVRLIDPGAIG